MRVQKIYTTQKNFPIDNIFNISQPEIYQCHIYQYVATHSYLEIRAYEPKRSPDEKPYAISFHGVRYIECPTNWDNANFTIASPQECLEIVMKLKYEQVLSVSAILENFLLFQVQSSNLSIRIVAALAHVRLMTPKDFNIRTDKSG